MDPSVEPDRSLPEVLSSITQDDGRSMLLDRSLVQTREEDLRLQESLELLFCEHEDPRPLGSRQLSRHRSVPFRS